MNVGFLELLLVFIVVAVNSDICVCKEQIDDVNENSGAMKTDLEIADEDPESRKKTKIQNNNDILKKIIPMLATPFILQTTFLPVILLGIKFMLIQSIFLGKLAIIFWIIAMTKNHLADQQGHLYSHNVHVGH